MGNFIWWSNKLFEIISTKWEKIPILISAPDETLDQKNKEVCHNGEFDISNSANPTTIIDLTDSSVSVNQVDKNDDNKV